MRQVTIAKQRNPVLVNRTKPDKTSLFCQIYNDYAPAFYGEIQRNLYKKDICDEVLCKAFTQIGEQLNQFDSNKENIFIWSFRIVRKEINKKKMILLCQEIFACQKLSYLSKLNASEADAAQI